MNILLTGGTGFLGSALARNWARAGHRVTLLVRATSSLHRVEALLPEVELAKCSSDSDIAELVKNVAPEMIVHTACAYGRQGQTTLQVFDANVRLGIMLLAGTIGCVGKRVAFLNTGTVLGASISNYAMSKHQFADWGDALARQNSDRLQFVNIRLQHMYGPGDDSSKFTTHVLHACQRNQPQLLLTAGEQQRDFIYIDDVVSAYAAVATNLNEFGVADQVDVGSGRAPSVRSFVEQVHSLTGSKTELQFGAIPYRPNEAMLCKADTGRLQQLGWQPSFSLKQGICKTIELEMNP